MPRRVALRAQTPGAVVPRRFRLRPPFECRPGSPGELPRARFAPCLDPGRRRRAEALGDLPLDESFREAPGLHVVSPAGLTHGFRRHDDPASCGFLRGAQEPPHAMSHEQVRIDGDRSRPRVFRHRLVALRFRSPLPVKSSTRQRRLPSTGLSGSGHARSGLPRLRLPARIGVCIPARDEPMQLVRAFVFPLHQQVLVFDPELDGRPPQRRRLRPCVLRLPFHTSTRGPGCFGVSGGTIRTGTGRLWRRPRSVPDLSSALQSSTTWHDLRWRQPRIQRLDEAAEVRQPALQFPRFDPAQQVERVVALVVTALA